MSITDIDMFTGLNKEDTSIALIQENEPPEGYQVCISAGGKDCEVTEHLCQRAGAKHQLVHSRTGIDPPEAIKFMYERYPNITIHKPTKSVWRWIETKGLPRRQSRWCCEKLKEFSGRGRVLMTGIRREESSRRSKRTQVEEGRALMKTFIHPILNWTEYEVWEYIDKYKLHYCHLYDIDGWDRLGCILCPMTSWRRTLWEWERYPKIANAWFRAAKRYLILHPDTAGRKFGTAKNFCLWWLTRGQISVGQLELEIAKRGLSIDIE